MNHASARAHHFVVDFMEMHLAHLIDDVFTFKSYKAKSYTKETFLN